MTFLYNEVSSWPAAYGITRSLRLLESVEPRVSLTAFGPRTRRIHTARRLMEGRRMQRVPSAVVEVSAESTAALLRELVAHLRENRTQLREEWVRRIAESKLLAAMTREEIFAEATSVYDNYVAVLESGSVEALQAYARDLSERIIPRG